ncbi:zinc ribbon domain-containing protein [Corynebacterium sp. AOP40-9SA-29]|uniref:zinc ribbon domain-containing protein n=1 Tax=Corynebacterium sp. AOP40-9SA-29 TaxID=3457677 RepID=UPI00403450D3
MPDAPTSFRPSSHSSRRPAHVVLWDLVNVDAKRSALAGEIGASGTSGASEEIASREKDVVAARQAKAAAERETQDATLRLQRMQQDAAKLRARRRDDINALGAAVDTETRRDLKHDLTVAERRLAEVEEAIEAEGTSSSGAGDSDSDTVLEVALAALESARESHAARQREITGQLESLQEHSDSLRTELEEGSSPQLLRRYDHAQRENGVGAAALAGSSCRACFMTLDRASLAEILAAPKDDPASCPECGVMLLPEASAYEAEGDRGSRS